MLGYRTPVVAAAAAAAAAGAASVRRPLARSSHCSGEQQQLT
jgi:hypothetical protein